MILDKGTVIAGRYEILDKLGIGGMAIAYRAKDKMLERYVTVKVLKDEFVNDTEFQSRFKVEARSAASLSHNNIVGVYDVGREGDINYIVMEYVHGNTLKKAIDDKAPFDNITILSIAIQIASALSHAHKNHVIHRDIKPQNILLSMDGTIKVTDFGIARAATTATVTTSSNALGSVHYSSPEQVRGGYVDEKCDIYSLGITMYEMATGKVPFTGDTPVSIALKHLKEELPSIREQNPKISPTLESIIRKAATKKADERYKNINLMLADMKNLLNEFTEEFMAKKAAIASVKKDVDASPTVNKTTVSVGGAVIPPILKNEDSKNIIMENKTLKKSNEQELKLEPFVSKSNKSFSNIPENKNSFKGEPKNNIPLSNGLEKNIQTSRYKADKKMPEIQSERQRRNYKDIEIPKSNLEAQNRSHFHISKEDNIHDTFVGMPDINNNIEPPVDKRSEKRIITYAVITAAVIIIFISILGVKMLRGGSDNSNSPGFSFNYEGSLAPDFAGKTVAEAEKEAEKLGLKITVTGKEYSNHYEEGLITNQDVDAGGKVLKDTPIGVTVSKGLQTFSMPDFKNTDETAAIKQLKELGPTDISVTYEYSESFEVGKIISQTPSSGTEIDKNTKISFTVSKGEESVYITVPNVVQLSLEKAKDVLIKSGFTENNIRVTESYSDKVENGFVISQSIAHGNEVDQTSQIKLTVSKGKDETVTPPDNTDTPSDNNPDNTGNGNSSSVVIGSDDTLKESSQVVTINAPVLHDNAQEVRVKVVQINNDGSQTFVLNTIKNVSDFPFNVVVIGKGKAEVQVYFNDAYQGSEFVNF